MADVICPSCSSVCRFQQNLGPGVNVRCAGCNAIFAYPGLGMVPVGRTVQGQYPPPIMVTTQVTVAADKSCPFCGEMIKAEAKKCRYCGELLDPILRSINEKNRSPANPGYSPGIAAVLSFFFPGVGQMYRGDVGAGIAWFLITILGYIALIIPGLIVHLLCVLDAARVKEG